MHLSDKPLTLQTTNLFYAIPATKSVFQALFIKSIRSTTKLTLLCLGTISGFIGTSQAQDDSERKTTINEIQIAVAAHAYEDSPSDITLSDLVYSYEENLLNGCFSLSDPEKISFREDEGCKSAVEELRKLDPTNPIAICAIEGMTSSDCFDARLAQKEGGFSIDTKYWKAFDSSKAGTLSSLELSTVIQEKMNQKQIKDSSDKIKSIQNKIRGEKSTKKVEALRIQLEPLAKELVFSACRGYRLALVSISSQTQSKATPTPSGIFDKDLPHEADPDWDEESENGFNPETPIDQLLKQFPDETAQRKKVGEPMRGAKYLRYRLVSNGCASALKMARIAAPNASFINCPASGQISQSCLSSRRLEHRAKNSEKKPRAERSDGFESF